MQRFSEETKKKVVRQHIQEERTISSLAAKFGTSHTTIYSGRTCSLLPPKIPTGTHRKQYHTTDYGRN